MCFTSQHIKGLCTIQDRHGLSIWGYTTEVNLNRVQRIQNVLARVISNNFDYIHSCGIDLV